MGDQAEFARRLAEAFNTDLNAYIAMHAEDVEHVTAPEWPERGTYRGRDEVRRLWESILADYGRQEIEVVEVVEIGEDRALSKMLWHAQGAASGVPTSTPVYSFGTMRDGLLARIEYFLDEDVARAAAGLDA